MIPLFHDFGGETVLVVGGGPVGARKARRFAREAEVVVVSPEFADADFGGAARVREAVDAEAVPGWLERADPVLVVAATDDADVNAAVAAAARERGILVNRADADGGRDAGSVVVPATVRDDPVVVAVSTGGRSPALSRYLREQIADVVDGAGAMAEFAGDLRGELRESYGPEDRRAALRAVVRDDAVWKGLDTPGTKPRQRASDVISDVTGDSS
ncbi:MULTISPECIES: precorrin-2 dehydrogenase/sirohydrochlorin ferrochelatase family protein [Salinibaculum]|uniref:precorrin-2 dehydrogenase/sirohydrochlorin ferrochelatase family protein n=1 Tax=Salinibaculum TaxID=2732368 RepID=UPI0030CD0B71